MCTYINSNSAIPIGLRPEGKRKKNIIISFFNKEMYQDQSKSMTSSVRQAVSDCQNGKKSRDTQKI